MYRDLECDEDNMDDCGDDYNFDDDNDYDFDKIRKVNIEKIARQFQSGGASSKMSKSNKKSQKQQLQSEFDIDEQINQTIESEDFENITLSTDMESISYFDDDSFEFNFETEGSFSSSTKSSRDSVSSFDSEEEFEGISDNESDFEVEEEIELEEEDIEVVEVVQRGEIIERKEEDRIYKESIQIAELFKMKIEEMPFYFRNNEIVIKNIKKEINKIIDLKNKNNSYFEEDEEDNLQLEEESSKGQSQDSDTDKDLNAYQMNEKLFHNANNNRFMAEKPLIRKYLSGDYSNHYLIPIILSNKKIYNNSKSKSGEDIYDSNTHFIRNFLQETETINQFLNKKKEEM